MKSQSSLAKQTWSAWRSLHRAVWLCAALLSLLVNGCSEQEQRVVETEIARAGQTVVVAAQTQSAPLQTQAAQAAGTAAAQGVEAVQTQAALVQQTAVAAAATQAAIIQQTAVASMKTRLPNGGNYRRQFPNIAATDKYLVGAYFYPWYGPGKKHWEQGYAEQPLLGEYDSADLDIVNRQIDWATGHGIDFFAVSFWGPNSREDSVLRDAFLGSPLANDIRFAIFYETRARLKEVNGQIDLDDLTNRSILHQDFEYLRKTYWNDPHYLNINGRPVVFLYLTRLFKGDGAKTFEELRSIRNAQGQSVFLIGDEVYWQQYHTLNSDRLRWFDAVTAYNMHASVPDIAPQFTEKVRTEFSHWQDQARRVGVAFVPGVVPGFDDRAVRPNENHPPIPRSPNLFARQLDMALDLTDPQFGLLMITSWNEWHEDTEIEPAQSFQFDYLTRLRAKLAERQ